MLDHQPCVCYWRVTTRNMRQRNIHMQTAAPGHLSAVTCGLFEESVLTYLLRNKIKSRVYLNPYPHNLPIRRPRPQMRIQLRPSHKHPPLGPKALPFNRGIPRNQIRNPLPNSKIQLSGRGSPSRVRSHTSHHHVHEYLRVMRRTSQALGIQQDFEVAEVHLGFFAWTAEVQERHHRVPDLEGVGCQAAFFGVLVEVYLLGRHGAGCVRC
jgi:hypothetical protein